MRKAQLLRGWAFRIPGHGENKAMTATLERGQRLDDATYQAKIDSVRAYVAQLERADQDADQGSLERAADLAAIYEDMRWVGDLPKPEAPRRPHHFRVVEGSRERFYREWVKDHITSPTTSNPLSPRVAKELLVTEDVLRAFDERRRVPADVGKQALAPLAKLVNNERAAEVPGVWRRAVKLAEADGLTVPGRRTIRRALAEHNKALGIKAPVTKRTVSTYENKVEHQFDWLVRHSTPEQNAALLKRLAERLRQEHRWARGEEWSA